MTALTWRHDSMGYAGSVWVASVHDLRDAVEVVDAGYQWELSGVRVKYANYPTIGTLKTLAGAQRAAERARQNWLEAAGVTAKPVPAPVTSSTMGPGLAEFMQRRMGGE